MEGARGRGLGTGNLDASSSNKRTTIDFLEEGGQGVRRARPEGEMEKTHNQEFHLDEVVASSGDLEHRHGNDSHKRE